MSQLASMAGCPKPQIATLPLAAGARAEVMGLMGEWPVYLRVAVHERSVIDSDNRRIEANRWVFWGSMGGRAIEFACQIAVFAQPPTCPGAIGAGLAPIPLPENFRKAFFGVFSSSYDASGDCAVLVPVAKWSSETKGLWPGRMRSLRGFFGVGESGGKWMGCGFSVLSEFWEGLSVEDAGEDCIGPVILSVMLKD